MRTLVLLLALASCDKREAPAAEAPPALSSDSMSAVGKVIDGRYKVTKVLGQNDEVVFLAVDHVSLAKSFVMLMARTTDRVVARKLIDGAKLESRNPASEGLGVVDFGTLPDHHSYAIITVTAARLADLLAGTRVFGKPPA